MEPNPYESPDDSAESLGDRLQPQDKGLFRPFEVISCCGLAAIVLAATAHRLQIGDLDGYRNSPLIFVEVLGVLAAFGIMPIAFFRSLYLISRRRVRGAAFNGLICLLAFGALLAAMWIDAPTLLYAT